VEPNMADGVGTTTSTRLWKSWKDHEENGNEAYSGSMLSRKTPRRNYGVFSNL